MGPFRGADGVTAKGVVLVVALTVHEGNDCTPGGHDAELAVVGEVHWLVEVVGDHNHLFPTAPPVSVFPDRGDQHRGDLVPMDFVQETGRVGEGWVAVGASALQEKRKELHPMTCLSAGSAEK